MKRLGPPDSGPLVKVSVVTIAYNQEAYIAEAVESVLMQECDFDFEYIIGDDASTDGTWEILKEYQRRYPERIKLRLHDSNMGAQRNLADALAQCTGQYVALLDGDDFWTSEHKLQTQVDFMDANPDCALSCHGCLMVHSDGTPFAALPAHGCAPERSGIEELLSRSITSTHILTPTVMYRWGLVELPDWWNEHRLGDFPLHVLHAQYGWVGYIDEVMAASRFHAGGMWRSESGVTNLLEFVAVLHRLDDALNNRYHDIIERNVLRHGEYEFSLRFTAATHALNSAERLNARPHMRWIRRNLALRGDHGLKDLSILLVRYVSPRLLAVMVAVKRGPRRLLGGK
ncbi:MAG: glycosyltransferase family 2 protein [Clostridiales bacterium]|nr:glycosyltransferase family 2 protein [Clostridiales bacterium]